MLTKTEIEAMSVDERAKLAEMLWDSMPEERLVEIPEWQAKILEERLRYSLEHPDDAIPLDEFLAELKNKMKHVQPHD